MDDFYLPEETLEWLSLKKSEYLSKLIENIEPDDFQFEEYLRFEDFIAATLSLPDWSVETLEDNQKIKTFCRTFGQPEVFHQMVIGALIPDQEKNEVYVPIISFVTRKESLVKIFSAGKLSRPTLN
ncbi:MAG: hypothetical protein H0V66_01475 [Bdellovibrionales bacterium]|nr:hypothetical protein [Bdellovibrionales bacterium]